MITALLFAICATIVSAQGNVVLAKRSATIVPDTSANNYIFTVIADTNWYEVNCSIDIPGYTIGGLDTLVVNYGEEGTTILFRLEHGTDFKYAVKAPGGDERHSSLVSEHDVSLKIGIHKYTVTGSTTIKTIDTAGIPVGYEVVMMFESSLTVDDGSGTGIGTRKEIELNGNADFSATSNDVLVLIFNGSKWVEKSRSTN